MKLLLPILIPLLFLFSGLTAQTVVNGSFETNGGSCVYNISNTTYDANMSNSKGFGIASQLDIIRSTCGYGAAQNGNWFVAMAVDVSNTQNDALSLTLSAPLAAGASYTLSWFDRGWSPYVANLLQVGVSTTNNTFGTLLYTTPTPTLGTWVSRSVTFTAPSNEQYVTARVVVGSYGWTHVDNFSIGVALPVSDLSVWAKPNFNGTDSVFWSSGEEKSFYRYAVQYLDASGEWSSYRTVLPKGGRGQHQYADEATFAQEGERYYRIEMRDFSGETWYSNVVRVGDQLATQLADISISPNPMIGSSRLLTLHVGDPQMLDQNARVQIFNLQGQEVRSLDAQLDAVGNVVLDLQGLSKGVYLINFLCKGQWLREKLVVE